ncbi:LysE family transporter [Actinocrinis puniceicyclus]|uniref:LysE family transporter n=1 Tax=Actinocrinis puniceicyclus TaxID=977794 RepID=A0A8J8BE11_9ACTN|nr:LysE family transporter [Actinocrinis puniceicyclus]MBS2965858.1 LysE family transporter [Actinocrinis puniceicyclus]
MNTILVAGLLAGFGIAVQVGAITVLIITLSAHHSLRTGLAAGMGTATADGLYALLAVTAGAGVAALLRPIAGPMRLTAAGVLILIAVKGVTRALRLRPATAAQPENAADETNGAGGNGPEPALKRPLRAYLQLLGLTILNPLTVIYFSVLVLGLHTGRAWSFTDRSVFVLAIFAASAAWQAVLAVGGAVIGRALTSARGRLGSAIVGNSVIALLAVHLIAS